MFIGKPTKWTTDPRRFADEGDILISVRAPVGPVNVATQRICIGRGLAAIKPKSRILPVFAFYILHSLESEITGNTGATVSSINKTEIGRIKIPLPSLEIQTHFISTAHKEEEIITANYELIELMEKKIKATLSYI